MTKIYSNIVPEKTVREIQHETLDIIASAISKSFGPKGSATGIVKNIDAKGVNIELEYTKDGYNIIKNILFNNPIERSVQEMLTNLTLRIVKEVGDGTTSAVLLCNEIFHQLYIEYGNNRSVTPADIINQFEEAVTLVSENIKSKAKKCTIDDIYDIALISTNNNEELAGIIKSVYEAYGLETMIDIGIANDVDTLVKAYDGMTLETGFTDICFVNDPVKNRAVINNPRIYFFNDPIDTPEMLSYLDTILEYNILSAYRPGSTRQPIPTVIFGKSISPDTSSYFETTVELMNKYRGQIPLLMVNDIHQDYIYEDLVKLCGAKFIKKYINPELQQRDIENGLAPTIENVHEFYGTAESVVADQLKTKIIRPAKMFDENGEFSEAYTTLVTYLETQVEKLKNENAGINDIATAKRRLYSLKGNMVDLLIGGISVADRNNLKASAEDAVLNCRSAAKEGVGYGANYMAWKALNDIDSDNPMIPILKNAYKMLLTRLYSCVKSPNDVINHSLDEGCPLNIRTGEYDKKVKSSIKSDIVILETISKILTLMYTCNQYLVQTPMHNQYVLD